MTREEFAKKIHWSVIVWVVSLLNPLAMIPQVITVMFSSSTEGLSLMTTALYCLIQVALTIEGFFTRNVMLMFCFGSSTVISVAVILYVLYLRM